METKAIAAFTAAAEAVFAANGGKVSPRLRFAVAREDDEAVAPVRKFLGPGHLRDADGANALRITIIDVTNGLKYQWNDGKPPAAEVSAADVQAFVDAFLAGSLAGGPVRA